MMPPEFVALSASVVCGLPATVVLAFRWMRHRERMTELVPPVESTRALAARLERLEAQLSHMATAVEAVAIEVERISEGQRFVTQLLAEREAGRAPALRADPQLPRGHVATPH